MKRTKEEIQYATILLDMMQMHIDISVLPNYRMEKYYKGFKLIEKLLNEVEIEDVYNQNKEI